jgi:hypothetical protein
MRARRAALMAFVAALLAWSEPAAACSCGERTLQEEVASSAAIFIGKVAKLEVTSVIDGVSQIEVTIERERVFKGPAGTTVTLQTSDGCCHCEPWFDIARRYLIFAEENEGALVTSSCSRTKLLDPAKDEVAYLEHAVAAANEP